MLDNLKRFREPVAWALLAIIVGGMVLAVARLILTLVSGATSVFSAFAIIANSVMNLAAVIALLAAISVCLFVLPTTPRAVQLTRLSAWVITVGTLITLIATIIGISSSAGFFGILFELLGAVFDIAMKVVCAAVLWVIYRAVKAGRMQPDDLRGTAMESEAEVAGVATAPVWQPGQATGAVWRTAAEAASGEAPQARPTSHNAWKRVEMRADGLADPGASVEVSKDDTPE